MSVISESRTRVRFALKGLAGVIGAVALTSCLNLNVDGPSDQPSDPATESFAGSLHIDVSQMQRTPSGVYYKDGPLGAGTPFTGLGAVVVTFVGYLKNGAVFQQGDSVRVTLGDQIVGLREGLQGMRPGGERLLVIPSALGFGNTSGTVPANSTLIYDIILDAVP